jgi:hypothetical protein
MLPNSALQGSGQGIPKDSLGGKGGAIHSAFLPVFPCLSQSLETSLQLALVRL